MRRPLTKSFVSHRDWLLPPPDALTRPGDPIAVPWRIHSRLALVGAGIVLATGLSLQVYAGHATAGDAAYYLGVALAVSASLAYLPLFLGFWVSGTASGDVLWRTAVTVGAAGLYMVTQLDREPGSIVFAVLWVAPFAAIMEWRRRRRHAQRSESRANQG